MSKGEQILKHLKRGRKITQLQALDKFKCLRLSARIFEFKEAGYRIHDKFIEVRDGDGRKCRVKQYWLAA